MSNGFLKPPLSAATHSCTLRTWQTRTDSLPLVAKQSGVVAKGLRVVAKVHWVVAKRGEVVAKCPRVVPFLKSLPSLFNSLEQNTIRKSHLKANFKKKLLISAIFRDRQEAALPEKP